MTTLTQLAERVERAEEGSRELDNAIWGALGYERAFEEVWMWRNKTDHDLVSAHLGFLTTSMDASLALFREKLPGWRWMFVLDEGSAAFTLGSFDEASNSVMYTNKGKVSGSDAAPRSVCAALLRALDEKGASQ